MANQVFVSHTQKDEEFCDIFDRACARVGIRAFRSEFEEIELPSWLTIRNEIRRSRALFLLIGKELAISQDLPNHSWKYTQSWISYEIGIACERGIDVWVVCDDVNINFPVPYVNNYLPMSLRHRDVFNYFIEILRLYTRGLRSGPNPQAIIECPYETDCKGVYNLNVVVPAGGKIICPQCLRIIEFPEGHLINKGV